MTKTASKQRTRTDFLCLTISAGAGVETWDAWPESPQLLRNRYSVSVASDATGRRVRFTYFDSAARCSERVDQLDRANLLEAFRCFVSDAQAGESSFADFQSDFGYDDERQAKRTWQACTASLRKFSTLFHDAREPSWCLEQLAAIGVE